MLMLWWIVLRSIYVWGCLGKLMKLWFWRNNTLFEGPHFGITHGDIAGYTSHRDPSTGWVIASAWSECHMGWLVTGTNFGQYPLRWCFLRCNSQQKDAETWCITAKCRDLTFLHLLEGCYNLYKSFSIVDICDDASDIDLILVKKNQCGSISERLVSRTAGCWDHHSAWIIPPTY